ncbi:PIH1 domain-containing protein 1-like isoform X2 [Lycorma delicatula]|uniref:PIH1 domain-containing protein 1-like isoform X2 n=1 Tax=Lycorma delicatula TaxID=130591 RepID=UPI003F510634
MAYKNNSVLLDVDPSILNKNLLINDDSISEDGIQTLLNTVNWDGNQSSDPRNLHGGKLIQPEPGFCIKCWKDSGEKLFINICHTEFIPRPEDITDSEIHKLMANCYEGNIDDNSTELENSKFFIPMSIGKLHTESDKGRHPCDVCDVAINSNFFKEKILKSNYFKMFLLTVAVEGVANKYNINLMENNDPIILKHCKVMGKIESQMIQIRKPGENKTSTSGKRLIEELTVDNKKSVSEKTEIKCTYQLLRDPQVNVSQDSKPKSLVLNALIERPVLTSSKGLVLDVGEDRVLLRTSSSASSSPSFNDKIILDLFLPYNVVEESCQAHFNTDNKNGTTITDTRYHNYPELSQQPRYHSEILLSQEQCNSDKLLSQFVICIID